MSITIRGETPRDRSSVAQVCRRSWNRIERTPARASKPSEGGAQVARLDVPAGSRGEHQAGVDPIVTGSVPVGRLAVAVDTEGHRRPPSAW